MIVLLHIFGSLATLYFVIRAGATIALNALDGDAAKVWVPEALTLFSLMLILLFAIWI